MARRAIPLLERFWPKVDKTPTCWIWLGLTYHDGYGRISVGGRNGKTLRAHRVAWELTYGAVPQGRFVLHNCPDGDNPSCVNPSHLWLGDAAENSADMVRKGRSASGDKHPGRLHPETRPRGESQWKARLSADDVLAIRRRSKDGERGTDLAKAFGVGPSTIYNLLHGATWRHT